MGFKFTQVECAKFETALLTHGLSMSPTIRFIHDREFDDYSFADEEDRCGFGQT